MLVKGGDVMLNNIELGAMCMMMCCLCGSCPGKIGA